MKKKLLAFLLISAFLFANTAGPLGGTGSGAGWVNPTNVAVTDGIYSTQSIPLSSTSTSLSVSSYGFSIPVGATINGITVAVVRHAAIASSLEFATGVNITKVAGVATGTVKTDATQWGITDATTTFGNGADLWGLTWSVSDINSTGFGFTCVVDNVNAVGNRVANIDSILITVTFTPAATPAGSQMFKLFGFKVKPPKQQSQTRGFTKVNL